MNKFYKDKQQIINWLDTHEVKNYILIPDEKYGFIVNVTGDVDISNKLLINIPVKFNEVSGDFSCKRNKLTSLEFCPQTVGNSFLCNHNKITSLEFSPQTVGNSFYCQNNKLTSLEFCPQEVGGSFYCSDNPELEETQEITDFKLILVEHKRTLITKFSDKLENKLPNDKNKKTTKIKI